MGNEKPQETSWNTSQINNEVREPTKPPSDGTPVIKERPDEPKPIERMLTKQPSEGGYVQFSQDKQKETNISKE
jgi:hypothetical protein